MTWAWINSNWILQRPEVQSDWAFRSWTAYAWPAYVLIAGMALSVCMMILITIRYWRARRRRIAQWNRPRHE